MPVSTPKTAKTDHDRRRRRHQRYRGDFQVHVSFLEGDKYCRLEGHCRDLSEAGIGILLATELKNGEVAGLTFSLPGSNTEWQVRAVVRYRRGYHYGFEFLSLKPELQESLKTYLTGLKPLD